LLTERQSANARNNREETNRARQAAVDLFKPRQQTSGPDIPARNDVLSAEHLPRRQPRILMARQPGSTVVAEVAEVKAPRESKSTPRRVAIRLEDRGIPAGQFGRIRALRMSLAQVAELYGVTVDEIDRVTRRPISR
jgi:hypothetical protein